MSVATLRRVLHCFRAHRHYLLAITFFFRRKALDGVLAVEDRTDSGSHPMMSDSRRIAFNAKKTSESRVRNPSWKQTDTGHLGEMTLVNHMSRSNGEQFSIWLPGKPPL